MRQFLSPFFRIPAQRKKACTILSLFLFTVLISFGSFDEPSGEAGETEASIFRIGIQTWFSSGAGEWQIEGYSSDDLSFLSRLDWNDLDSNLLVLKADYQLKPGIRLSGSYGTGDIENGRNTDSDWYLGPEFDSGAFKFSESISETDGQTVLFDINIIIDWFPENRRDTERLYFGAIIGYQIYEDELIDRDGIQTVVDEVPVYEPFEEGQNATYSFKWQAYRAGVRGRCDLTRATTISMDAALLIGVTYRGEGFWNLRTDMRPEPPNLINEADSGWGGDFTLWLSQMLTRNLSVEIGWKSLYLMSESGIHTSFLADGSIGQTTLSDVKSSRNGYFAGITCHF